MVDWDRVAAQTFVAEWIERDELPSTNDFALRQARDGGRRLPLLVLTARQTQGRGRGVNRWWSSAGSLTFSLLLDLRAALPSSETRTSISLVVGLSVCEALATLTPGHRCELKWPNDVLLDGKKVCGILVESPAAPPGHAVLGIGINVNNSFADAPAELRRTAISLRDATGATHDLTDALIRVLQQLASRLADVATGGLRLSTACAPWSALDGRSIVVQANRQRITGLCAGIDDDGALVVATSQGRRRIFSGTVESFDR